jgi:signal transduction histidine kinase/ActR/RegA family two-component response regulator
LIGSGGQTSDTSLLRVLLIEDSPADAELVLDELRGSGMRVEYERVDNAGDLRAALGRGGWQLVLCTYSLPRFDALAALAIVEECQLDLPFIIISDAIADETAVAAMRAGAHDFLIKGKLARLVPAVERELREAAIRAERAAMQRQVLLSDRLVQIGTLAAGVAHEINNPLAYVIGNIAIAIDELSGAPDRTFDGLAVVHALNQALEGAERIRATTADLRVFSRTEDSEPHPIDLRRVLESSISMAWNQIRHRAKLVREFDDVPPIAANENRVGQVFLNLLINAAHAIPEGNAAGHEIRVSLRTVGAEVQIEVRDSGHGISPEVREHLFQPFLTTKSRELGTGLGLSICQKIVRDLGGEISLHENPTGGTTSRVCLPLRKHAPSDAPARRSSHPPSRRGRVLVIDDEPAIVDIVERLLRSDHDTVGVVGGRRALQLLRDDRDFDVVFCDLTMPDMSGVELYEELQHAAPELIERMVFLTGGAFTPATRSFLARVENLRLQKPFDSKTLHAAAAELVRRIDGGHADSPGSRAGRAAEATELAPRLSRASRS